MRQICNGTRAASREARKAIFTGINKGLIKTSHRLKAQLYLSSKHEFFLMNNRREFTGETSVMFGWDARQKNDAFYIQFLRDARNGKEITNPHRWVVSKRFVESSEVADRIKLEYDERKYEADRTLRKVKLDRSKKQSERIKILEEKLSKTQD